MRIQRVATSVALLSFMALAGLSAHAQVAGATPGQFSVSQSGAASYRIPIQVPPGVSGMAPQLELVYNSQRGNGMLGLGWGLSGLSAITRCGQTPGQDGNKGSVNMDANDRFCLDGQRLILLNGTYGVAGSEYRTEIDTFSKIVANGSAGNGPSSFTVQTKAGLTLEYGNTTDSRVLAVKSSASTASWLVGNVRTWAQNKTTDQLGNYMTLSYDQDAATGAYYPRRIDYTGNTSSTPALTPSASLQFVSDTTRLDTAPVYMAGALFNGTKRINALRTYIGTTLVKEYRLAYATQTTSLDKSKLLSLTECEGTGVCLAPVALAWGSAGTNAFAASTTALSSQFGTAQGWTDNNTYPRMQVDVNGDGLTDIVGFGGSGVSVALNKGDGTFVAPSNWLSSQFSPTQGWSDNNTYPRFLADVNGDGLPDIVGFSGSGVSVAINNGAGFNAPANWLAGQFSPTQGFANNSVNPRFLADVNGDGLVDIVGFASSGGYVALNTGSGFSAPNTATPGYVCPSGQSLVGAVCGTYYAGTPVMGCVNSFQYAAPDGTCWYASGDLDRWAPPQIVVGYSCPYGGSVSGSSCFMAIGGTPPYACPIGYTLSGSACLLSSQSSGNGGWFLSDFGVAQGWMDNLVAPRYFVDINGDGLPDIVGFGPNGLTVALNTGTGFAPSTTMLPGQFGIAQGWTNNNIAPRYLVDVNGDGLPDIVGFTDGGVTTAINTGSGFISPVNMTGTYACASGQFISGANCNIIGFDSYGAIIVVSTVPATYAYTSADSAAGLNWTQRQFGVAQGWATNLAAPRYLVDVNADGLPDIVGFGPNGVMVSLNTGTTFAAPVSWNTSFGSSAAAGTWSDNSTMPRVVVDVNGDGLPDIVGFSASNLLVATNSQSVAPNFVGTITTSTGASIAPSYSALTAGKATNSSIYTKDSGATAATFPKVDMAAPYYVVSSVAKSNGVGGNQTTSYTYGGLKFEAASGRGMLGFRWFKSRDQQTGIDRYSEYNQSWPTTGLPTLNETRLSGSGNAGVLQRTVVTLGCQIPKSTAACAVTPGNSYFPYAAQTVESNWDLNGAAMPVTTSAYTYGQNPQFGDPTQIVVGTDDGASKTTVNNYYPPDTTRWIVGRLQSANVISVKP